MNLHGIVSGAIGAVNPFVPAQIKVSTGSTTLPSGKREPSYSVTDVSVQLQALSYTDLMHIDGMNIQGVVKAAYVNGNFNGVNRPKQQGGDLLVVNGEEWLIVKPLEEWPDWCKFVVNLQRQT
jgi:hypothetical protein